MTGMDVALVLPEDGMLFELAIAREVFGEDRSELAGVPQWYRLRTVALEAPVIDGFTTVPDGRYADLLDAHQRALRDERGLASQPIVATITRGGDVPIEIPLFGEPDARIQVYTEAPVNLDGRGARVDVETLAPGTATTAAALAHLGAAREARSVLCEGGPTLLRALVEDGCLDDMLLTLAPLAAAGDGPTATAGDALEPPAELALRDVHRAGDHLVMHYVVAR